MLSDMLMNTDLISDIKKKLDESQYNVFITLLSAFKSGKWLYPGVIKRKVGITTELTYDILDSMEQNGLLKEYYELYCSKCQRLSGDIYETISDLPNTFYCEMCNVEMSAIENAILVYKVV